MKKDRFSGQSQSNDNEKTMISLKEWNWKLEQSISQLHARINAVENRLSIEDSSPSSENRNQQDLFNDLLKTDVSYEKTRSMLEEYEKNLLQLTQSYQNLQQQINLIEQKQKSSSIIMHLKGREFPIEITGIIGGLISLLIAFIIGVGGTDLVISPVFLSIIGLVLIGGTFFRSFGGLNLLKSMINKKNKSN